MRMTANCGCWIDNDFEGYDTWVAYQCENGLDSEKCELEPYDGNPDWGAYLLDFIGRY